MRFVRGFVSGAALPAFLMPFILCGFASYGYEDLSKLPFFHFIPFVWGVWNGLTETICRKILPPNRIARLLLSGFFLGLLIALYGVFVEDLPERIGFPGDMIYLPLIVAPIAYAIVWVTIVNWLDSVVGLNRES